MLKAGYLLDTISPSHTASYQEQNMMMPGQLLQLNKAKYLISILNNFKHTVVKD